jgi:hypothetical protein
MEHEAPQRVDVVARPRAVERAPPKVESSAQREESLWFDSGYLKPGFPVWSRCELVPDGDVLPLGMDLLGARRSQSA